MWKSLALPSGFTVDFMNMFGDGRLQEENVERELLTIGTKAELGMSKIRLTGKAKGHLSKDGTPEPVYFMQMPYIKKDNPNTVESINKLQRYSKYLRDKIDAVIFLGIGGSYLGNKVLFDILAGDFWNTDAEKRHGYPRVYFSGNNLDAVQCIEQASEIKRLAATGSSKKEQFTVMLVPISKSGTTLEPMSAFTYFYNEFAGSKTIKVEVTVVTDLCVDIKESPLLQLAEQRAWQCFDIKEGIGGRFSVFTDPGLVTLSAIGGDIEAFLCGARELDEYCKNAVSAENPALLNALLKYLVGRQGCDIEVFMGYSSKFKALGEWYVQLLAESLGKRHDRDGKLVNYGRTPVVAVGSTDMHAQTQQHQDGRRNKIIQFLEIADTGLKLKLSNPFKGNSFFGFYKGLELDKALKIALAANEEALASDGRYSARYVLPHLNEYYLGQLLYFLMLSIAYEGELANVDAYDQPGVEAYKKIMKSKIWQV